MKHFQLSAAVTVLLIAFAPAAAVLAQSVPYHTTDLTAAFSTCGVTDLAYVDLQTREYIKPATGTTRPDITIQAGKIEWGCASRASSASYAPVTSFSSGSTSNTAQSPLFHSTDLTTAYTTCGQSDLAYVNLPVKQYVVPQNGTTRSDIRIQANTIEWACASKLASAGYAKVGAFSGSITNTTNLAAARQECGAKYSQAPVGTLHLTMPDSATKEYFVWNPHAHDAGYDAHFDDMMNVASLRPAYTCKSEISSLANGLPVLLYADFSHQYDQAWARVHQSEQSATNNQPQRLAAAPVERNCRQQQYDANNGWNNTFGNPYKVVDDSSCTTTYVLGTHLYRDASGTIWWGNAAANNVVIVRHGTLIHGSSYWKIPLSAGDDAAARFTTPKTDADIVNVNGKVMLINAQMVHPTNVPGWLAIVSPGQKPTFVAASVIAAGSGNVIAAGSGNVIAAGSGNVIAAGSGNVIAAGSGNVIAAGSGNLISNIPAFRGMTLISEPGSALAAIRTSVGSNGVIAAGAHN